MDALGRVCKQKGDARTTESAKTRGHTRTSEAVSAKKKRDVWTMDIIGRVCRENW